MNGPTELNGLENLANYSYKEILEQNLISFLDWGLINAGGFTNNYIPASGAYGGDYNRLRYVNDVRYSGARIWESARMNWVWETGIGFSTQPIAISGLFIGSTFYPVSGGTYYIDYPNGRVVFNNAISKASTVKIEYSNKWVNVTSTYNVPWLRISQNSSFRVDDTNFLIGSGAWAQYGETRMQFPTIAIEVMDGTNKGFQIGGGQYSYNRVNFFTIGEEKNTVDRLSDIIQNQNEKTIYLYDSNKMVSDNKFPLNQFGSPNTNFLTYPSLVQYSGDGGYRYTRGVLWGKLTLQNPQVQDRQQLAQSIYQRSVTLNTEAILTSFP